MERTAYAAAKGHIAVLQAEIKSFWQKEVAGRISCLSLYITVNNEMLRAMKLGTCDLTRYLLDGDKNTISLCLLDQNGDPVELEMSVADASEIATAVPLMLSESFARRIRDSRIRAAIPLDGWSLESTSDGAQVIVTFTAEGGLVFSFATEPAACRSLGTALASGLY